MYHSIFIYSSIGGHFSCFHVLAIVSNAALYMAVQISFWVNVLISFEFIPRNEIAGSYGCSIFNFLMNFHTVYHSGCTNLQYHQSCTWILFSTHPCEHLLFLVFLMIAILKVWGGIVALLCIFLTISDVLNISLCACWPSVCLLCRNVYTYPLPIF